jgi:hypothetical protein
LAELIEESPFVGLWETSIMPGRGLVDQPPSHGRLVGDAATQLEENFMPRDKPHE